jgi:hypothetical protein
VDSSGIGLASANLLLKLNCKEALPSAFSKLDHSACLPVLSDSGDGA